MIQVIRVVHSSHFQLPFGSFLTVWQMNDRKVTKKEMKNEIKMATVKPLEHKKNKKEAKMHFTLSTAGLGTFKLPLKGLSEFISMSFSLYNGTSL